MKRLIALLTLALASHQALAAQARSLPPDVLAARLAEPHFTHEVTKLHLPEGKELTANILVPGPRRLTDGDGRLAALIVFGGFEEAGRVLELLDPKVPVIVSSFDYPYSPPRRFRFPDSLEQAPEAKRAIRETINGTRALLDALKARGDVDPDRITIVGASFGAPFAMAAAAANHDISGVILVHGFGAVPDTIAAIVERRWERHIAFLAKPAAWLTAHLGWFYLDPPTPEDSATKLSPSQHVLMITATEDTIIPHASVESLWHALGASAASHERVDLPGDHLQPGSGKLIAQIEDVVSNWLQKANLR